VKPHVKKLHVSKEKKDDEIQATRRDSIERKKERKKGDHIFL
jgi:hypothetical protein